MPAPSGLVGASPGDRVRRRRGVVADPFVFPRLVVLLRVAARAVDRDQLTGDLLAVRGAAAYWTESETGLALMHVFGRSGYNEWIPTPRKTHRYLIEKMPPAEVAGVIEDLMIRPPRARP